MTPRSLAVSGIAGLLAAATMVGSLLVLPADDGGTSGGGPADLSERYAGGAEGFLRAAQLELASLGLTALVVAGLTLWAARRNAFVGTVVAAGGIVLVSAQLMGYAVIATLSLGTAAASGPDLVVALYDLSAVLFVVANVGLTLLAGATATAALGRPVTGELPDPAASAQGSRHRVLAAWSLLTAAAAVVAAMSLRPSGAFSPHGDVGFVVLVLQVAWTTAAGVTLLRDGSAARSGPRPANDA